MNKVAATLLRGAIISLQFTLAERVDSCNHRLCKGAARVVVPGGVVGPLAHREVLDHAVVRVDGEALRALAQTWVYAQRRTTCTG